jgi:hypothetical protein
MRRVRCLARDTAPAALALWAAAQVALGATPPPAPAASVPAMPNPTLATPAQAPAPSLDGSFPVTLTLNGALSGIPPQAVKGAWFCSARALSKPAIDAELAKLGAMTGAAARAEYGSFLEYRAHYLGQQTTVEFPITAGAATGNQPVTIKVTRDDLVDPVTKRVIDQPAVVIGCWLRLIDAAGQGGFAYQVAKPTAGAKSLDAILQLASRPYVLASAIIPNE